jgi:hypothetical protein
MPAYAVGWGLSLRYASHEEESMASAKSLCAFVVAVATHGLLILFVAALFLFTPPGWMLGMAISYSIERMHVVLLDETYDRIKLLVASYRLFSASLLGLVGQQQLAGEDQVTNIAVDVVKSMSAVQYSLIKTLRKTRKSEDGRAAGEHEKEDAAVPSSPGLPRPLCSRLMGATIQAHSNAQYALNELFTQLEKVEKQQQQQKEESAAGKGVNEDVLAKWQYLRTQMERKDTAGTKKSARRTKLE